MTFGSRLWQASGRNSEQLELGGAPGVHIAHAGGTWAEGDPLTWSSRCAYRGWGLVHRSHGERGCGRVKRWWGWRLGMAIARADRLVLPRVFVMREVRPNGFLPSSHTSPNKLGPMHGLISHVTKTPSRTSPLAPTTAMQRRQPHPFHSPSLCKSWTTPITTLLPFAFSSFPT